MATGLFATIGRSDDADFNRAVTMSGMSPDQAITFGRIRGAQAIGNGLSGPTDADRAQRARDRIRAELLKLPEDQRSDPLAVYPLTIRVLQEEGLVEEALKLAAEYKSMHRQDREQTRKEEKDVETADIQRARIEAMSSNSPLMQGVRKLDQIEQQLSEIPEGDPRRAALLKQQELIVASLAKQKVTTSDAGDRLIVMVDGVPVREIAKGAKPRAAGTGTGGGKLPAGYRWKADGSGEAEPIPGTAAAAKAGEAGAKDQRSLDVANDAIAAIDRLLSHPGLVAGTGMGGRALGAVPGTDAYNFRRELESVGARVFSVAIQSMRGMGSLSDAEGKRITDSFGAIDPNMSADAVRSTLQNIRAVFERAAAKIGGAAPAATTVPRSAAPRSPTAPKATLRFNSATGQMERI